jgi:hypothetical protein
MMRVTAQVSARTLVARMCRVIGVAGVLLAPAAAQPADWDTYEWQVECIDPQDCAPADAVYAEQLRQASEWLDGLGFEPPAALDNQVLGGRHLDYRIANVSDADVTRDRLDAAGYYDAAEELIWLRSDVYFNVGEPGQTHDDPFFYIGNVTAVTSVHELFHAVQNAPEYEIPTLEEPWRWLRESTATAVQIAFASDVEQTQAGFVTRHHDLPLHEPATREDMYKTARFWLFLGQELQSADRIAYLDSLFRESSLSKDNGIEGIDDFLEPVGGLYKMFPRYIAEIPPEAAFASLDDWQVQLEDGKSEVTRQFSGHVRQIAGSAGRLRVTHHSENAVEIEVRFSSDDADLHLIVDGRVQELGPDGERNVFRSRLESDSETFDIVVAEVAERAERSQDRDFELSVRLREVGGAWVRLDGETFRINAGICNQGGVVAMPDPENRSIAFTILAPGGETRVDWGAAAVSASLFANGCSLSQWPPCKADKDGNAGGPRVPGVRRKQFNVNMDYDIEQGIWTGSGQLYSVRGGTVPVEFFIQCNSANRSLIR